MGQNSHWTADLHRSRDDLYKILEINASSVLEKQIETAVDAAEHGNSIGAIGNLTRLNLLISDLNHLKERRAQAFKTLRKDMINSKDDRGAFHGARFEVHMAAQMSLSGLTFAKSESPDFTVEKITLECTSCRLIGGKTDPMVKLNQTIDAKASEP